MECVMCAKDVFNLGTHLMEEHDVPPIMGQEAICPDGLGRVVNFRLVKHDRYIEVKTYVEDRSCKWGLHDIELIDPRGHHG